VVHDAFEHRQRDDSHETIMVVDDPELLERLRTAQDQIIAGVEAHLPAWIASEVTRILDAWSRLDPVEYRMAISAASDLGGSVTVRVVGELRTLFAQDVGDQRATPVQIVRSAYREPTDLFNALGIPGVVRDAFDERVEPADIYGLSPQSLADLGDFQLGPALAVWGIAKSRLLRARLNPAE
jgi:hypothetical protein